MFCRKCGKKLDDDSTICSECAAAEQNTPQSSLRTSPVKQPTEQNGANYAPASQTPVESNEAIETIELNTTGEEPKKPKKPQKKTLVAWITSAVAVVLAASLVIFNFTAIKGFFLKHFGTPEAYVEHVEEQNIKALSDTISSAYGSLTSFSSDTKTASSVQLELEIGDDLMELLQTALAGSGSDVDLDFLSKLMVSVDSNVKDGKANVSFGAGLSGKQLLTLDMIYDMEKQVMWIGLPELNDQYIMLDMSELMDSEEIASSMSQFAQLAEIQEVLPSEKTLNKLLTKYMLTALKCVEDVEKETETVEIDGVSQKLTVLTTKINQETMIDMAIAVLEEAKDDKELKKIIDAYSDYMNDYTAEIMSQYDEEYEPTDLYEEFTDGVKDLLDELEEAKDDADDSFYIKLVDYIGSGDNVVGRKISVHSNGDKMELFSYLMVEQSGKFAFEAEIPEADIEMTGSGTIKSNKMNGKYEISYADTDLVEIEVIDFDQKKLDNGYLSGTFRITPTSDLLDQMGITDGGASMMGSLIENISLELVFDCSEKSSKVSVNLVSDNELLLGLALSAIEKNASAVKTPDNALDISDMDDEAESELQEWLENTNFDGLLESLEDAGVPKDYIDQLEDLFSGGFGSSYEAEDYYNDYYGI